MNATRGVGPVKDFAYFIGIRTERRILRGKPPDCAHFFSKE